MIKISTLRNNIHTFTIIVLLITISISWLLNAQQSQQNKSGETFLKAAQQYEANEKNDSALIYYSKAIDAYKKNLSWSAIAKAQVKKANILKNLRRVDEALLLLRSTDSLCKIKGINDIALKGEAKHIQGAIALMKGDPKSAIPLFNASLEYKIKAYGNSDTNSSVTYNNLGLSYLAIEKFDLATKNIEMAIKTIEKKKKGKLVLLAKYRENLGIIANQMGDYQLASTYFKEALRLKKSGNADTLNLAGSYANLGSLHINYSNYDSALIALTKAEELYNLVNKSDYTDLDAVYNMKGNIFSVKYDYEKALAYYNKTLLLLKKKNPNHPKISEVLMNIGHIYFIKEEFSKALEFYKQSLILDQNSPSDYKSYRNLARCYAEMKMPKEADENFKKSIKQAVALFGNTSFELALGYTYYARFLSQEKKNKEAFLYLNKALDINTKLFGQKNRDVANTYIRLGFLEFDIKNYSISLQYIQKAIVSLVADFNSTNPFEDLKGLPTNPDIYLMEALWKKADLMYQLYEEKKDVKYLYSSLYNYQLLSRVANTVRSNINSDESNFLVSAHSKNAFAGAFKTTFALYRATGDKKYLLEGFRFAERSKSAVLLAELRDNDDKIHTDIDPKLRGDEKELRNSIANYKKLIYEEQKKARPSQQKLDLWRDKVFELEKKQELLAETIRQKYPEYYKIKYGDGTLEPSVIQKSLKEETILEYALTDNVLYTFLLSKDTLLVNVDTATKELESDVRAYVENIRSGPLSDPEGSFTTFTQLSYKLYTKLIKPFESEIRTKKLVIIPDGILGYLPFETLIRKPAEGEMPDYAKLDYLIKSFIPRYSYLATMLHTKLNEQKKPTRTLGAFAPVYSNSKPIQTGILTSNSEPLILKDIPGSQQEVKAISDIFSGVDIYRGDMATERIFKEKAGQYAILHLAMHTLVDEENPMFSKMVFTNVKDNDEDNLLNTYEIYNIPLNAQLAVLSSCNTGNGTLIKGEGIVSLARGFVYTGIPTVIMTLWEVEDESGTGIMADFYKRFKDHIPVDEALRESKLNYLNSADKLRSHPYFWSAYVSIGEDQVFNDVKTPFSTYLVIGLSTLILLFALVIILMIKKNRKSKLSKY